MSLHKKKVIAKSDKDGKRKPNAVQLPAKPETLPSKQRSARQMFSQDTKEKMLAATDSDITKMWDTLSAEDKRKWEHQADNDAKRYRKDMEAFYESVEGKKYRRELLAATRRRKIKDAKDKYLKNMPKKPAGVFKTFRLREREKVKKENPDAKPRESKRGWTKRGKS